MIENIKGTKPIRERRRAYPSKLDFSNEGDRQEPAKNEWFNEWEKKGIEMHNIPHEKYYWYDYEALRLFKQYGVKRFYSDDIWVFDWEQCRMLAISEKKEDIPKHPISPPNFFKKKLTDLAFGLINTSIKGVRKIRSRAVLMIK
jgi:hypothetical protein